MALLNWLADRGTGMASPRPRRAPRQPLMKAVQAKALERPERLHTICEGRRTRAPFPASHPHGNDDDQGTSRIAML